jgi:hypothetical protein
VVAVRGPEDGDPTEPPAGWDKADAKGRLPGIDKGWNYAPGASRAEELRKIVAEKVAKLPEPLALDFTRDVATVLPPAPPKTVDQFAAAGKMIMDTLPADPAKRYPALMQKLEKEVGTGRAAVIIGSGKGADLVKEASRHYPASWVSAANQHGDLHTKLDKNSRGWSRTLDNGKYPVGSKVKIKEFGVVTVGKNPGYIVVKDDVGNAIHEYAHRLQRVHPKLQELFRELHDKRTAGEALESLKKLKPTLKYKPNEWTRQDHYIDPYWGKEYSGDPREVMTMAFQTVLAGDKWKGGIFFDRLYNDDREMFDFVVGLLFHWKP